MGSNLIFVSQRWLKTSVTAVVLILHFGTKKTLGKSNKPVNNLLPL